MTLFGYIFWSIIIMFTAASAYMHRKYNTCETEKSINQIQAERMAHQQSINDQNQQF